MFHITLRVARELLGLTVEEAAKHCDITVDILDKFEEDSQRMPVSQISKILTLYSVSSSLIYFGSKTDCIQHNRMSARI